MDSQTVAAFLATGVALLAVIVSAIFSALSLRNAQHQATIAQEQARTAEAQTKLQREIAEKASQPTLWVDVRTSRSRHDLVELVVGNSGPSVATNVRVKIDPPLPDQGSPPTFQQRLREGVISLPPYRDIQGLLFRNTQWYTLMPDGGGIHHVTIDANDARGPLPRFEYDINMADLARSWPGFDGTLYEVADVLRKIERKLPESDLPAHVAKVSSQPKTRDRSAKPDAGASLQPALAARK